LLIYLVEDDNSIRELVAYTLHSAGFRAEGFEKPSAFWHACKTQLPDLVLLDLMLPEEDGISILKKLRNDPETRKMPIILLTAKSSEYDKVMGLENGADDYVAKPFSMMELLARVKALLRRVEKDENTGLTIGDLFVDKTRHEVMAKGQKVTLTLKEFELLCLLLRNSGRVVSRETLIDEVWGYAFMGESRTVDVHIRTLRQKLGEAGTYIETVRGYGYKIGRES
jgi:two-component system alkaline phosphatase synthesis response regulator PhoP